MKVIIAGAGMAAHLPGMCAALFPMPVIGVPMSGKNLAGDRRTLFYRTDAAWNPGCNRGNRRRNECGDSCSKDPGNIR